MVIPDMILILNAEKIRILRSSDESAARNTALPTPLPTV